MSQRTAPTPSGIVVINTALDLVSLNARFTVPNVLREGSYTALFPAPTTMEQASVFKGEILWRRRGPAQTNASQNPLVFSSFNGLLFDTAEGNTIAQRTASLAKDYYFLGIAQTDSAYMPPDQQHNAINQPTAQIGGVANITNTGSKNINIGDRVFVRVPRPIGASVPGGPMEPAEMSRGEHWPGARGKYLSIVESFEFNENPFFSTADVPWLINPEAPENNSSMLKVLVDAVLAYAEAIKNSNLAVGTQAFRTFALTGEGQGVAAETTRVIRDLFTTFHFAEMEMMSRHVGIAMSQARPGERFDIHVRQVAL